jgi:glutamine synthetase
LREYIKHSKKNPFEGDGYSEAWEIEAKRGLSNFKTTPLALKARASKQALDLFSDLGIMNHIEVEARYEIELEEYTKKIQIEGRVLGDIATNQFNSYSLPKHFD